MLKLYNFLKRKIENFQPINPPNVTLYTCGPTVYDFVHIGNFRTFIFEDVLRRTLEFAGYKVKHVMNITDIDDKIIQGSREQGIDYRELGEKYTKLFFQDLERLNIKKANFYPKATEHIQDMIKLIKKLLNSRFAYKTEDGVYFDISKFANYGQLSNLPMRKIKVGARVASDLYEKENPADFALWKFRQPNSSPGLEPSWEAPFGQGRPGWHIECSAMSMKYLGERIDIHTGAVDLLFPHHENEIAQSEAVLGQKFVNFWLEGEHLLLSGQKISKSLGNIITLSDLEKKGFNSLAFRYLCLTAHYRSKLNFTWEGLKAAQNALESVKYQVLSIKEGLLPDKNVKPQKSLIQKFSQALSYDLDTPAALTAFWQVLKSDIDGNIKYSTILKMDQVLGLNLAKIKPVKLPKGARQLIAKREELRAKGDFATADKIRLKLKKMGVEIEDTKKGPRIKVIG